MEGGLQMSSSIREQSQPAVLVKIEGSEGAAFLGSSEVTDLKCDVRETGLLFGYPPKEEVTEREDLRTGLEAPKEEFITGDLDESDDDEGSSITPIVRRLEEPKIQPGDADLSSETQRGWTYKCRKSPTISTPCPTHSETHLQVHKTGATSSQCSEGGWSVTTSKMMMHQPRRHTPKEQRPPTNLSLVGVSQRDFGSLQAALCPLCEIGDCVLHPIVPPLPPPTPVSSHEPLEQWVAEVQTPHHLRCEICNRTFNNTSMKSQHLAQHSRANFPCTDCSLTFRWASGLARHRRKAHCTSR